MFAVTFRCRKCPATSFRSGAHKAAPQRQPCHVVITPSAGRKARALRQRRFALTSRRARFPASRRTRTPRATTDPTMEDFHGAASIPMGSDEMCAPMKLDRKMCEQAASQARVIGQGRLRPALACLLAAPLLTSYHSTTSDTRVKMCVCGYSQLYDHAHPNTEMSSRAYVEFDDDVLHHRPNQ